jgi:hypothetical protein
MAGRKGSKSAAPAASPEALDPDAAVQADAAAKLAKAQMHDPRVSEHKAAIGDVKGSGKRASKTRKAMNKDFEKENSKYRLDRPATFDRNALGGDISTSAVLTG